MILSFIIQTFLVMLLLTFSEYAVMMFVIGEKTSAAVVMAVFALLSLAILCRYRKYRKRVIAEKRDRKAQREAAAFATVAYMAEEDAASDKAYSVERAFVSGGTRFCCCVCEKWKPRRNAEAVLYEGRKVSGIICDKCAASFTPKSHETVKAMPR
jgi:hypothetical protein